MCFFHRGHAARWHRSKELSSQLWGPQQQLNPHWKKSDSCNCSNMATRWHYSAMKTLTGLSLVLYFACSKHPTRFSNQKLSNNFCCCCCYANRAIKWSWITLLKCSPAISIIWAYRTTHINWIVWKYRKKVFGATLSPLINKYAHNCAWMTSTEIHFLIIFFSPSTATSCVDYTGWVAH